MREPFPAVRLVTGLYETARHRVDRRTLAVTGMPNSDQGNAGRIATVILDEQEPREEHGPKHR